MSEIQRFDFEPNCNAVQSWGTPKMVRNVEGYYARYTDILWYKRHWALWAIYGIVISLAFGFVCSLLVYEKASHGPVTVPMGAGEKAELLQEVHAAKVAKDQAQADLKKARADYAASQAFFANRAKELEGKITKDIQRLERPTARGMELHGLAKYQAAQMSTHQGVALEAKRVLGVEHVQIVER